MEFCHLEHLNRAKATTRDAESEFPAVSPVSRTGFRSNCANNGTTPHPPDELVAEAKMTILERQIG
jgi:hypothetical protein